MTVHRPETIGDRRILFPGGRYMRHAGGRGLFLFLRLAYNLVSGCFLAAAIPAVIAYNFINRRIRVLSQEMDNFTSEFLNIIKRNYLAG